MKSMIFGLAILGLAAPGVAYAAPSTVQKIQYESCDQRCQEHRREEAREREEHYRMEQREHHDQRDREHYPVPPMPPSHRD
jgi:hypothetical protein